VIAIWIAACALLGGFFATQTFLIATQLQSRPVTWGQAMRWGLATWVLWGILAAPIAALARRFPFGRRSWPVALAVHVPASGLIALLHIALVISWYTFIESADHTATSWGASFRFQFILQFHWNVFIYAAVLGVIHAFSFARTLEDREIRASRLEAQLSQARLDALRMQLNPHFLFNTLNAISTLVHENADAADRMIVRLSDLLRAVLDSARVQKITLRDEMAFVQQYLEIESTRFKGRLHVRYDVDAATLDLLVPTMLLQPLVENAMRHAVAPHVEPCTVEIAAVRHEESLVIEVRDTGRGATPDSRRQGHGVGLANTNARLQSLYGDRSSLTLLQRSEGGCTARAIIPAEPAQ
jgi:two-component system, LytTR family, sensor kinase